MKKSYLMIAAAAGLMLAACSQEDDFVAQNAAAVEQGDGAVLFDTYLSNTNTRAGEKGVMTTSTLQKTGFGIMALEHAASANKTAGTDVGALPNFMWNQYVGYEASNWVYSPLKYWPNDTEQDSQDSKATEKNDPVNDERVTFFAYAPYVTATATVGTDVKPSITEGTTPTEKGIVEISKNTHAHDPYVKYVIAQTPSNSVDLLWGVSSGFSYHPVKGGTETMEKGLPVLNMTKPAIDEKVKFDFKHALARIGMTVVGAFDQVAVGGDQDINTRITVKEVTITGAFEDEGYLDLNNKEVDRAKWLTLAPGTTGVEALTRPTTDAEFTTLTLTYATTDEMNPDIAFNRKMRSTPSTFTQTQGVTTKEQDVISVGSTFNTIQVDSWLDMDGTTYYSNNDLSTVEEPKYKQDITYFSYNPATYSYDKLASAPTVVDGKQYYVLKNVSETTKKKKSGINTTELQAKAWYTKGGTYVEYASMDESTDYYLIEDFEKTKAKPGYKPGTYYSRKNTKGYFMVIPAQYADDTWVKDLNVTVSIKYEVATIDPNLDGGITRVENNLKQTVTLKDFTNGKAYNLKLILGLTSIKVDAEVSNWETGTVESNLPQNLE